MSFYCLEWRCNLITILQEKWVYYWSNYVMVEGKHRMKEGVGENFYLRSALACLCGWVSSIKGLWNLIFLDSNKSFERPFLYLSSLITFYTSWNEKVKGACMLRKYLLLKMHYLSVFKWKLTITVDCRCNALCLTA